ncbi:hypothetical protein ACQJBY_050163 [Aegilops geniculata]
MAAPAPTAGSSLHSKTLLKSEQLYQVNQPLPVYSNQIKSPRAPNSFDPFPHSRHISHDHQFPHVFSAAVHTGVHGVPARARLPPGAARRHHDPPHGSHGGVAGPGAAVWPSDRDARRQERHRGRRVHRVLAARHRPCAPRRRQGRGHRRYARELRRDRVAGGREGRDGAQDRLPRWARAAGAG